MDRTGISQVLSNAHQDSSYRPYCMRCSGLIRMAKVEAFFWKCGCGAVCDLRPDAVDLGWLEEPKMKPVHVTLESNEGNKDGCAVTVYFHKGVSVEQATDWIKQESMLKPHQRQFDPGPLWVDVKDSLFEVVMTEVQPFPEYIRFQAHPTC